MSKDKNLLPCIIYRSPRSGNERKIVVVDGIPYYESTGQNSGSASTWFPFVMLRGTTTLSEGNIPDILRNTFAFIFYSSKGNGDNYVVKYDSPSISTDFPADLQIHDGRIPTKETLITSYRLNSSNYETSILNQAGLNSSETDLAHQKLNVEKNPVLVEDTDEVNEWLIAHGAVLATKILTGKHPEIPLHKNKQEKLAQFEHYIEELNKQAASLNKRGYKTEATTLTELCQSLHTKLATFKETNNTTSFWTQSTFLISQERSKLTGLRGLNYYFDKLVSGLLSLAGIKKSNPFRLFKPDTDKKIDKAVDLLNEIKPQS